MKMKFVLASSGSKLEQNLLYTQQLPSDITSVISQIFGNTLNTSEPLKFDLSA